MRVYVENCVENVKNPIKKFTNCKKRVENGAFLLFSQGEGFKPSVYIALALFYSVW